MDPITLVINFILSFISASGYLGIFLLMVLESALIPIPSEVIMTFSGFLAYTGTFDIWLVVLVGTLGNLLGSWIAYFVGIRVGRAAILRYGRYVMLRESHLSIAENWFRRYGDKMIFLSRMTPLVRTVISLPAGISRMDLKKFSLYTFVGSIPWNIAMAYIGFILGQNWVEIEGTANVLDILVVAVVIAVIAFYIVRRYAKKR